MKNFIILTFIVTILISCNSPAKRSEIIVNGFTDTIRSTGQRVNISNTCRGLAIHDSLIIICNNKSEKFLHVYNLDMDHLGSFGRRGKGPNEFIGLDTYKQIENIDGSLCLWTFDHNARKMHLINISESLLQQETVIVKTIFVGIDSSIENSVFVKSNDLVVGSSTSNKGQLFFYDKSGEIDHWSELYPDVEPDNEKMIGYLYRDYCSIKPDKTKIVSASLFWNRVDIYGANGKFLNSIVNSGDIPKITPPGYDSDWVIDNWHYYIDVFVTDEKIYALYVNTTMDKLYNSDFSPVIHSFDWEGNPLQAFILDIPIDRFVVDESSKTIIGGHFLTDGAITLFHY